MSVRIGHLRFWLLRKFGSIFSWLERHDNQLAIGLYGFCRWFWEIVSPSKVYRIVSFTKYLSSYHGTAIPLKTNRVGYAANAVSIGRGERQILKQVKLPDLMLYCLDNVSIHHGSDFIANVNERILVNDYCANKNDDNKGYEDRWCYWQTGKVAIVHKYKEDKQLKTGIMLLDKYSFNYYHNMYENLIRLCVLEECNDYIPADVPIVVDEEIFRVPSFKRVFEILTEGIKREVVIIKKNELFSIGKVYYITPVNSLVPNHKDFTKGRMEDVIFDKDYTMMLRYKLLAHKENESNLPKRFFITRKSTTKRNFNEEDLYAELKPYGFQMIAPEDYSFEQQMTLFNNAEWIVGGAGAALTNLLFLSSSSIVICLVSKTNYVPPVFSVPVCFNNAKLCYFQSNEVQNSNNPHANFTFKVDDFHQFVIECVAPNFV